MALPNAPTNKETQRSVQSIKQGDERRKPIQEKKLTNGLNHPNGLEFQTSLA